LAHNHSHHPDHHHSSLKNIKLAFWLNTGFALLVLLGGIYTNSVAILSDALHDFGDSLSLGLAHYFEKKSLRSRDKDFSYGYKRFSLLGAFINSIVLIVGSVLIIKEAVERVLKPEDVNAKGMLLLAIVGVVVNLVAMLRLRKGSSVNERVVSLHFLEDVLGWVAVLIGSVVMMLVHLPILDPILSILIACFILYNVYKNLRQAFHIILQGIPDNVDITEIKKILLEIPGIINVHDLHSWTMDGRYNIMTVHVVLKKGISIEEVENFKLKIRNKLLNQNIQHLTIETEQEGDNCSLIDC
jgi:cobalt-zinc-cadmium efflux system protein